MSNVEENYYAELIERFISDGEIPINYVVERGERPDDPIVRYLFSVMDDSAIRAQVIGDPVGAIILRDDLMRFVDLVLSRKRFRLRCTDSEAREVGEAINWSHREHSDDENERDETNGWTALLMRLDRDYSKYGFRSALFREKLKSDPNDKDAWKSLHEDYEEARGEMLQQEVRDNIENLGDATQRKLSLHLKVIPECLNRTGTTPDDFRQAWSMMGGEWNEHLFSKLMKVVRLQEKHPELLRIAAIMGRKAAPEGALSMWSGRGHDAVMDRSAKSDIEGVGFGADIGSAMPMELALMVADDTADLFSLRFATRTMQVFRHRSETHGPTRRLFRQRAMVCGPMIVCIDTSRSMAGRPYEIARSMLMKLITVAEDSRRQLFVVAFSVSATPIDAIADRRTLLKFFASDATGGTDGTDMLVAVADLLRGQRGDGKFVAADVLVISDFFIPLPPESLLRLVQDYRKNGTHFLGLQVGDNASNEWLPHFDEILQVYHDYIPPRGK